MKLANYHKVAVLVAQRQKLLTALTDVKADGFGVTIRGTSQDEEMQSAVRSAVLEELSRRIRIVDEDLKVLGVEP